jgi:hypothetical protein
MQSGVLIFSLLIGVIILVLFCRTLFRVLSLVSPENRTLEPILVYLLFIPFVSLIMNFVVVVNVSNSIRNELADQEYEVDGRPTFLRGIIYAILNILIGCTPYIGLSKELILPVTGGLSLLLLIFFFSYWSQVNWYRKVLSGDVA